MPRILKKRSSSAYRGRSHHKVCIMSAVDDNDNMFFEIVGLGSETNKMLESIEYKIKDCNVLISDGKFAFEIFYEKLGYVNDKRYNLSTINGLHKELKTSLKKRKGVSIKQIQGYLDMLPFEKMLNYTVENQVEDIVTYDKSIPNQTKQIYKRYFRESFAH